MKLPKIYVIYTFNIRYFIRYLRRHIRYYTLFEDKQDIYCENAYIKNGKIKTLPYMCETCKITYSNVYTLYKQRILMYIYSIITYIDIRHNTLYGVSLCL
jgi:hypothetical protein